MNFFEICAEVLVPKFTRAEVWLPDTDAQFPVNFKVHILELITTIADERFWTEWFKQNSFTR